MLEMGPSRVGRPLATDYNFVNYCILQRKDEIIVQNKIAGKTNDIWNCLSKETGIKASGLYSRVTNNRYKIKELLGLKTTESVSDDNSLSEDFSIQSSSNKADDEFNVHFSKAEFDNLVCSTEYTRKDSREGKRRCAVLKPGEWQLAIQKKMWEKFRISCAYNFRNSRISLTSGTGTVSGECKCGSVYTGLISDTGKEVVTVECSMTRGSRKCGKRPCRSSERCSK